VEGLIMEYQLNVPAILRRGEQLFGDRQIVTRLPDRSWHRYTYGDFAPRADDECRGAALLSRAVARL